jgi:hypothetical protein
VSPTAGIFLAAMLTRLPLRTAWPLACLLVVGAGRAHAQPDQPPESAQPPAEQPAQPAQPEQPAQPPAEQPAEPAQPAEASPVEEGAGLEDRIKNLEGPIEGLNELMPALQADVAGLKRLKFSGYVQGRYEWHDDADYGLDSSKRPPQRGTNRFYVRRGRLKATYVGMLSEYMLQIDATGDGVVLRDAEASFHITNENPYFPGATEWELKLTMGQFKVPFGFEVLQSSSDRELPERTAVIRALFPGERDRGVRLQYGYDFFRLQMAVINGNFTNDSDHATYDQSSWKDVAGRVGLDFGVVVFGVSGHVGRYLRLTRPPTMMMPIAGYERYSRLRLGADAQAYYDIEGLGGFIVRGEAIWAKDESMDFGGVAADPNGCKDANRYGWYVTVVQNVGDNFGLAARVDQYDPNTGLPDVCMMMSAYGAAKIDRMTNFGVALLGYVSGNLKASVAYEHFGEQGANAKGNDAVTVQMQAKF